MGEHLGRMIPRTPALTARSCISEIILPPPQTTVCDALCSSAKNMTIAAQTPSQSVSESCCQQIAFVIAHLMLVNYARVSTEQQGTEVQLPELKEAGCRRIYQETVSGGSMDRPELAKCLDRLDKGDTLVVWRLIGWAVRYVTSSRSSIGWTKAASTSSLSKRSSTRAPRLAGSSSISLRP